MLKGQHIDFISLTTRLLFRNQMKFKQGQRYNKLDNAYLHNTIYGT